MLQNRTIIKLGIPKSHIRKVHSQTDPESLYKNITGTQYSHSTFNKPWMLPSILPEIQG